MNNIGNILNDEVSLIHRNKYLCRSCKKLLISKESLDTHIIICYESRLDKLREDHKKEIETIKSDYDHKIDEIIEYMSKHIDVVEKKHITLNNYLISQIKTLSN